MPHRLAQRLVAPLLALLVALTGLVVVGTTAAAGAARADFAPMRIGDTGWRVRKLQSRLHQLDLIETEGRVRREELVQEARRLGIEASPDAGSNGKTETPEDCTIRLLIEREVSTPSAGEEECRRFYENNPARFRSEPIWEPRHILLPAPAEDKAARNAAREQAKGLIAHLTDRLGLRRDIGPDANRFEDVADTRGDGEGALIVRHGRRAAVDEHDPQTPH